MSVWNKFNESLLQKWCSMAKTYSIMHSSSSQYYNNWDKRLTIPVILLGAVTASSIFTSAGKKGDYKEENNTWIYINGGMTLFMTGLLGVSKFLGTHEKISKHGIAAFKYTQISMNIETVLSFPRNEREENPRNFINDMKLAILDIREHSPDLPTWIVTNYINKLDKTITNTKTKVNKNSKSPSYSPSRSYIPTSRKTSPSPPLNNLDYELDIKVNESRESEDSDSDSNKKKDWTNNMNRKVMNQIVLYRKNYEGFERESNTRLSAKQKRRTSLQDRSDFSDPITMRLMNLSNKMEYNSSESDTE